METSSSVLVGSRLRAARKHAGLSQLELAERCSTRQSHISSMEKELRAPSIEMLKRLADVLEVSVQWLCGYDQTPGEAPAEIGPKHLLSDASAAAGLVALAADRALADSLDIRPAEWSALRSLAPAAADLQRGLPGRAAGAARPSFDVRSRRPLEGHVSGVTAPGIRARHHRCESRSQFGHGGDDSTR